jgi:hypothetical protein
MTYNIIDPNNFSFPRPGITGWRDRTEGPMWVTQTRRAPAGLWPRGGTRVPFCVFSMNQASPPLPGAVVNNPPCRHTAGFVCCRWGQTSIRMRRSWPNAGCWP